MIKTVKNSIPADATGLHLFTIKGKIAYIGYWLSNGNFSFAQIPYEQVTNIPKKEILEDKDNLLSLEKQLLHAI